MQFSEDQVRTAAGAAALSEDQLTRLLTALHALPRVAVASQRFNLVHLMWYAGALLVIGAMGLFSTLAFEQMGGRALTATGVVYAIAFLAAGHHLWHRRRLVTPGGLLVTVAVAMAPLAVYGVQDATGAWGETGDPGRYKVFYELIKGGWLPMEIATVIAGIIALAFYPFPFIVAVIAGALWFMSMDLTPWLFGNDDMTWVLRRKVSMWFGLALLLGAWMIDLKRPRDKDFGFWLHLAGLVCFWGAVTFTSSSSEIAKALYCLMNVGLVALAIFLGRRAYAVFGAIGISFYLGHLAEKVFADSLLFPFALSLIGVAIIAAGLYLHRHQAALAAWMANRLPGTLRRLRPAHVTTMS
jgi:hypothetical protein